ncbi:MAG: aldo/keto reductase [Parvibaculum sp.]
MTDLPITSDLRPLGKSGLQVFPLAYGMWRFAGTSPAEACAKIDAALEAGMTLFDTADIYGIGEGPGIGAAESLFGEVLKLEPGLRDQMLIATKGGIEIGEPYNSSDDYLTSVCEGSLKRMGIEQIDLYQIHRPDLLSHPEKVAATLTRLRAEGKIAHVGVSNHTSAQFDALQAYLDFPLVSHQPEMSCWTYAPLFDGVIDQAMKGQAAILAWSPLAGGLLGAHGEPKGAKQTGLVTVLDHMASVQGVAREAVALAWLLAHPANIIPIVGTQTPQRIRGALDAFKVKMSRQDWYNILQAAMGERLP